MMSTATAEQCNGLSMWNGLMTWPTGICMNAMESGNMTSHMVSCDEDGNGSMTVWNGPNCEGEMMSVSIEDWTEGEGVNTTMICNATDCDFAIVKSYDVTMNTTSCQSHDNCTMVGSFCYDGHCDTCEECHYCSDGVDGTCGLCGDGYPLYESANCTASFSTTMWNETMWNTTTTTATYNTTTFSGTMLNTTTTMANTTTLGAGTSTTMANTTMFGASSSTTMWNTTTNMTSTMFSTTTTENEELCGEMDAFENWQEVAVAVHDCVVYEWGNNTFYLGHVCQDGDFEIEFYANENCTGTPFHSETHWAQEGFCPEVTCNATNVYTSTPTTEPTMVPSWEPTTEPTTDPTTVPTVATTTTQPTLAPHPATCNGLKVWEEKNTSDTTLTYGHVTHPVDACMNVMEDGTMMSRKVVCDEYGAGFMLQWNVSDCQGTYSMSESVEDMFEDELFEMVCDAEDCAYAVVKSFNFEDSEESMEDDIDCSDNDLSNWEEIVFVVYDCEHSGYELESAEFGTFPVYVSNVCEDGGITMEYYTNSDCEAGSLLDSSNAQVEDHPAILEGLCPEVTCEPLTSTSTSTEEPEATGSPSSQCNGADLFGLMQWPADVCLNANDGGDMTSHKLVCNDDGSGSLQLWYGGHCQGNALMEQSLSEVIGDGITMVCDAVDCEYAIIRQYDNGNNTNSSSSWPDSDPSADALCQEESGTWQEQAIVIRQCTEFNMGDEALYLNHACDHAGYQMEYHDDAQCEGTPAMTATHSVMEGICPEVTCSSTESPQDGSATMNYLIAVGFTFIAVLVGFE